MLYIEVISIRKLGPDDFFREIFKDDWVKKNISFSEPILYSVPPLTPVASMTGGNPSSGIRHTFLLPSMVFSFLFVFGEELCGVSGVPRRIRTNTSRHYPVSQSITHILQK